MINSGRNGYFRKKFDQTLKLTAPKSFVRFCFEKLDQAL